MAALQHDSSVVLDSVATSPEPAPPKPRKTYGRSKRFDAMCNTGTQDKEQVPSTDPIVPDTGDVHGEAKTPSNFRFKWQEELARLDESSDDEDASEAPKNPPITRRVTSHSPPPKQTTSTPGSTRLPPSSPFTHLDDLELPQLGLGHESEGETGKLVPPASSSVLPSSPRRIETPPTSDSESPHVHKRSRKATRRPSRVASNSPSRAGPSKPVRESDKRHKKVKAPTKKELRETCRDRVRIANEQQTSIPRAAPKKTFHLADLFGKLQADKSAPPVPSDPIDSFSSPSTRIKVAEDEDPFALTTVKHEVKSEIPDLPLDYDDDDDDLPDASEMFTSKKNDLRKLKEKALQQQKREVLSDDSDDDLFIAPAPHTVEPPPHPQASTSTSTALSKPKDGAPVKAWTEFLMNRAREEAEKEKAAKVEAWKRMGGEIKDVLPDASTVEERTRELIEKAAENHNGEYGDDEYDEDEDPEDENYAPPREYDDEEEVLGLLEEDDLSGDEEMDRTMVDNREDEEDENDEDEENIVPKHRHRRAIVDGDSDDENMAVERDMSEGISEGDGNKENEEENEDKENSVVTRPAFLRHGDSLHGLTGDFDRSLRQPLAALESDSSPLSKSMSFTERLRLGSSGRASPDSPPLEFAPLNFGGEMSFSQSSQETLAGSPLLQPGFGDLFSDATQKKKKTQGPKGLQKDDTFTRLFGDARKTEVNLGLTQDVAMQAVLEPNPTLKRQADEIFEREQEILYDAAANKKPELYVNENGFLTQTRPDHSPVVYRPVSPSQRSPTYTPYMAQTQRQPLSTISYTRQSESPSGSFRPMRLKKRRSIGSRSPSSSPTRQPKPKEKKTRMPRLKNTSMLEQSGWVEGEAEESDEDHMEGFGATSKKAEEDEEDGDHLDAELKALVDNARMDEATIAEDKIQEKFKEHQKADDEALEKIHRDAIEGKYRHKRKSGLGFGDSDDEDDYDDSEDRRRRRKMAIKERQDINELREDPRTKPFADAYNVPDDGDEYMFALPETQESTEGGSQSPVEEVKATDIRRQLVEASRVDEDDQLMFDPEDLSHIVDSDDEDGPIQVREMDSRQALAGTIRPRGKIDDELELDAGLKFDSRPSETRLLKWAKDENRPGRMGSSSRAVVNAAITGHKSARLGGGSLNQANGGKRSSASSAGQSEKRKPPARVSSMLAGLSRKGRFE